jgi:hypothetical protein
MKTHVLMALACMALVVCAAYSGSGAVKSGPQVGDMVPGPFHPLNVTGAQAGKKHCLYCEAGGAPVAMIFAREVNPNLTKLIKAIDAETLKNGKAEMVSFVVFLSNDEKLGEQLKKVAEKEGIKKTILSIDNPSGPEDYNVAKDADVTVVLYRDFTVAANHAFRKGQLDEKAIAQVVSSVPKILPK